MLWSIFKTAPLPRLPLQAPGKTRSKVIHSQANLLIRNQTFSDIEYTRDTLMRAEGWSGMLHAWPTIFAQDPDGFFMLELDNTKIASLSMITYPEIKFAYVGMYVVDQMHRNQGFGKLLFEKVLEHTVNTRGVETIGLNCYETMSPLYQAWGFKTHTVDYIWKLSGHTCATFRPANILSTVTTSVLDKLVAYDTTVLGTRRLDFLNGMIQKPNTATVFAENEGQIKGYGIISQRDPVQPEQHASYRIGPFYASNPEIASELLQRLVAAVNLLAEQQVFMESSDSNPNSRAILTQFGFAPVASMVKMYRGEPPKFAETQIYGYSSLAFGG